MTRREIPSRSLYFITAALPLLITACSMQFGGHGAEDAQSKTTHVGAEGARIESQTGAVIDIPQNALGSGNRRIADAASIRSE
jgi:hypothetical protein